MNKENNLEENKKKNKGNKSKVEILKQINEINPSLIKNEELDIRKFIKLFSPDYVEEDEIYGIKFYGKNEARQSLHFNSVGALNVDLDSSIDYEDTNNLIIEGDNYEVLKILQNAYFKKVKCIYIDPPYNTGKEFIYSDNFSEGLKEYLISTGQLDSDGNKNKSQFETGGRKHSNWLRLMYPRLSKAYELLRNDGVIFISIDDNELANLKLLMNEIFGEENFIETFIWQKNFAPKNDAKFFSTSHDYILCYAKNKELFTPGRLKRTAKQNKAYTNPDNDPRGPWINTNLEVTTPSDKDIYEVTGPTGLKFMPTEGRSWRVSEEKMKSLIKDDRVWWGKDGNSKPRQKRFLNEIEGGVVPQSIILYKGTDIDEKTGKEIIITTGYSSQDGTQELKKYFNDVVVFDFPKPSSLIKRLIEYSGAKGEDIVLDFFAGSGSTGEAVFKYNIENETNLEFILIQLQEDVELNKAAYKAGFRHVAEITKHRIVESGKIYKEKRKELDVGFKNYILSESNFKRWNESETSEKGIAEQLEFYKNNIKDNAVNQDLVNEILLNSGYPLTTESEEINHKEKYIYSFNKNKFLIVVEKEVNQDLLDYCMDLNPEKITCLDISFENKDVLKANFSLSCKNKNIIFEVV